MMKYLFLECNKAVTAYVALYTNPKACSQGYSNTCANRLSSNASQLSEVKPLIYETQFKIESITQYSKFSVV